MDLDTEEEKKETEALRSEQEKEFGDLLTWMTSTLEEQVKEVRLSTRLTSSPACIVSDNFGFSPQLEKMYRASGQPFPHMKRILELNPTHPLVTGLRDAQGERKDDDALKETAELLYGTAVLAEGGELKDPVAFSKLLADRLGRTL